MSKIYEERWAVELDECFGHADISEKVRLLVQRGEFQTGLVVVSVPGSTAAVTTIEYEEGALSDLHRALEELAPEDGIYEHNERWGDGNGFSHLRSALLKPSMAFTISGGHLQLGTWQQIVVINLDNRPRERNIVTVAMGV